MKCPNQRDLMISGELYDPMDAELVRLRLHARKLTRAFNATSELDIALREELVN